MRRVILILPAALTAWLLLASLARAEKVYRDEVQGFQTASAEADVVSLLLNAEGDLPGPQQLTLRREGAGVTGGSWTLTVMPPGEDPTAAEKGRLTGGATGGTLTFDGEGALVKADSVQLTIQSGTGQYAGVRGGGGSLRISFHPEDPPRPAGTVTLPP